MAANEPVVRRLEVLSDHYKEFAQDPNARILRWLLQRDEVRMVEAFIAMEEDERASETADVFIKLNASFENPHAHGYALRQELVQGYQSAAQAITESGVNADWNPPPARAEERDVAFFVRTCRSLLEHYRITSHLVLVLRPDAVTFPDAYPSWLERLSLEAPERLRIMLFDDAKKPGYAALASNGSPLVRTSEPKLDMPAALEQISLAGGNLDTPGGKFRHLFVKLGNALQAGDLTTALSLGDMAVGIATAASWFHLAVPVQFALGAALAGAGRHQEALVRYGAAEAAALQGESECPEEARAVCPQLRLHARLGRGSTLVAAHAWRLAAELYEETAPLAVAQKDARTTLDCYRLACFCHEQNGTLDDAFRLGLLGMQVAREMDKETLKTSTFPYLGEGLMRLTQSGPRRGLGPRIESEIITIAGTRDWRPKQEAPAPAAPPVQQGVTA